MNKKRFLLYVRSEYLRDVQIMEKCKMYDDGEIDYEASEFVDLLGAIYPIGIYKAESFFEAYDVYSEKVKEQQKHNNFSENLFDSALIDYYVLANEEEQLGF